MLSVLDVFDNFLGHADCRAALRLDEASRAHLVEELRRFYDAWMPPPLLASSVFSGSWAAHNASAEHGRTILGNDLLLFERVTIHDPIEPYVSLHSVVRRPPGAPDFSPDHLSLAWVDVPAANSGRRPVIHTAVFPPRARAFLAVSEADEFSRRDWRDGPVSRALAALEEWRPLIQLGAISLVPAIEMTHRESSLIAIEGERNIARVASVLEGEEGHELTSFFSRGLHLTPGLAFANNPPRDRARHVSWVYARELAIAAAGGSTYAAEFDVDSAIVQALLRQEPTASVTPSITDSISLTLPGFSDVPLGDIAAIRRDEAAFGELRRTLSAILTGDLVEPRSLPRSVRHERIAERLWDEIQHIDRLVRESHAGFAHRFSPDLLTIGVPLAISGLTQDLRLGAVGAGTSLLARLIQHRPNNAHDRALIWIQRHLSRPA